MYFDALTAYSIINGLILDFNDFYTLPPLSSRRSGKKSLLYVPKHRLDSRKYCFALGTAKLWNPLPETVKNMNYLTFKKKLRNVDFSVFLKGHK